MSQNVIQFSCGACQAVLTVPIQMAGVTGPCPKCGTTVTSPNAPAAPPSSGFSVPSITEAAPPQPPAPPPAAVYQPPAQPTPPPPQPGWSPPPVSIPSPAPNQGWGSPPPAVTEPDFTSPSSLGGFGASQQPAPAAPQMPSLLSSGTTLPARRLPERPQASGSLLRQVTSGSSGVLGGPRQNPSAPLGAPNQSSAASAADDPMASFLRGMPAASQPESQQPIGGGQSPFPTHIKLNLGGEKKKGGKLLPAFFLLLVLGGLGYAGWYFLEPIKQFALPYFSPDSKVTPEPIPEVAPDPPPSDTKSGAFDPESKTPPVEPPTSPQEVPKATPVPGSMEPPTSTVPPGRITEVKPALAIDSGDSPSKTAQSLPPSLPEVVIKADAQSEGAAKALASFFSAKDQTERLKYTLGASSVAPLMSRYYEKEADGPILVNEITLLRYDETPGTGGGAHCVFTVSSKLWEFPIPVMLQEEEGTFKVDWLAFVEFRDNLLYKFLSQYQEAPVRFHVGIRRTHYFEDDVPELSEKDCFEIQPPLPTYVGYVFVSQKSALAKDLATKISWETSKAYVIVELRWRKEGDKKWVELLGVPQLNWYSFQIGSKPAPTPKATPSGKK